MGGVFTTLTRLVFESIPIDSLLKFLSIMFHTYLMGEVILRDPEKQVDVLLFKVVQIIAGHIVGVHWLAQKVDWGGPREREKVWFQYFLVGLGWKCHEQ